MWDLSELDDTVYSTDITERIDWLDSDDDKDDADQEELEKLIAFRKKVNNNRWEEGLLFIKNSFFEEYAKEFAEETISINCYTNWPFRWIDWKKASNELQTFYTSIKLDGVTYWYRG